MKYKLKLVMLLVVGAAIGIVVVLGSWLYGSYHQRMGLFRATAEQSLFESVQDVMQEMEVKYPDRLHVAMRPPWYKAFLQGIRAAAPEIPKQDLENILDSILRSQRQHRFDSASDRPRPFFSRQQRKVVANTDRFTPDEEETARRSHIMPFAFLQSATLTDSALQQIKHRFDGILRENGLQGSYVLRLAYASDGERSPIGLESKNPDMLSLRPMLIDPQQGRFIFVHFDQPWEFLLYSMSWQLVVSLCILAVVLGTFFYLFITILKQNKLHLLRKAFVNSLTHELRTPVTTVSLAVDALHDSIDASDVELREQYHLMAVEELDHLSGMIDRVLDIADADPKEGPILDRLSLDFSQLIRKSVAHVRLAKVWQDVSIDFEEPVSSVFIKGDAHHLKNVISNLLDNALKYGAKHILVQLRDQPHSDAHLRIEDDGVGIPTAYQQQVFEPFFRVPRGDQYSVKGFGLGLPYVKRILEQHGGKIEVKHAESGGALFIINIPKLKDNDRRFAGGR
ncbi:sensor histidine kinase [Sphingobacterium griseoflavum]|uniref:histidine kinase n=1 Tax=Sphingobacterium griseoflavum TaxID=1474952 RepID=A0ABQ3I446_9SPHI|nr:HAMP domain-containing sensor histidine kinase [Sphingobacterium griseoflavum]GHE47839.1 hypothetical protein GCM10017764_33810 [Sphingobacterium griseoflavum]